MSIIQNVLTNLIDNVENIIVMTPTSTIITSCFCKKSEFTKFDPLR